MNKEEKEIILDIVNNVIGKYVSTKAHQKIKKIINEE